MNLTHYASEIDLYVQIFNKLVQIPTFNQNIQEQPHFDQFESGRPPVTWKLTFSTSTKYTIQDTSIEVIFPFHPKNE